ncbi:Zinc finger protein [Pseudolycoriella hygida]|uniref:Zinc finger protein n=1 Tax=Pseudolycoriella hygida TaxID=35572 RepID=A0A9Q0MHX2_9DIPT|nr:Zinc finger protein [Pseudolycoriella hygida]
MVHAEPDNDLLEPMNNQTIVDFAPPTDDFISVVDMSTLICTNFNGTNSQDQCNDLDDQMEVKFQPMMPLTVELMKRKSLYYMGLEQSLFFRLLQIIKSTTRETSESFLEMKIMLTLRKQRLNEEFEALGDLFDIDKVAAQKYYAESQDLVSSLFHSMTSIKPHGEERVDQPTTESFVVRHLKLEDDADAFDDLKKKYKGQPENDSDFDSDDFTDSDADDSDDFDSDGSDSDTKSKRDRVKCPICRKSVGRLNYHMETNHLNPQHLNKTICGLCFSKFKTHKQLRQHQLDSHNGDSCVCDVCGRMFQKFSAVKEHILNVHSKLKPFLCDICGTGYASLAKLNVHKNTTHYQIRNHACDLCSKKYFQADQLQAHIRSAHTKERPFTCRFDGCNKSFGRFDGVEYRLVREITKSWKIQHILRDKPHLGKTPFETTIDDLKNYTSDLAMCSVWLTGFDKKIDTSTHYSRQCGTLMVPKPKHLSKITAIYRTLKLNSWLTFGLFFFIVVILLRTSATFFHVSQSLHSDLSGSFLDVMNIATAHGAASLWKQQPRSTKILLMSWTFVCSLLGICYATIYTSYLAKPGYEKLINSVEDFVENDMYFGSFRIAPDLQSSLNASSIPSYHNLLKRFHVFASISDAETDLASRKFGIYAGIEYKKYFVSYSWIKHMNLISSFRLINKLCIFNYYTVFGLQKFSPYTELFSKYALQFQEHGITDFWYDTIYRQKNISFDSFFEDYPRESKEPIALQFASISGAILVLLVSHTISIVVFVCELGVKYSQQSYRLQY